MTSPSAVSSPSAVPSPRGSVAEAVGVVVYALVDWLVIMAPALAVQLAADRGGIGDTRDLDLTLASAIIATGHAVLAARRLRYEERTAARRLDIWIASIDALVVLALTTTLLVLVVLVSFPDEHAALANRGYPIIALWAGLQLVGVALAEVTGRLVFRWLEPGVPQQPSVLDELVHPDHAAEQDHRGEGAGPAAGSGAGGGEPIRNDEPAGDGEAGPESRQAPSAG